MGTREIFKENLKYYRKQKGLSQEKLSELIGYGTTYITEIESRNKFPRPETIDIIAEKLEIEPHQLFQKLGCPENIKNYTANDFLSVLSDSLYTKLTEDFRAKITKELSDTFQIRHQVR
ncbi:MAG: helix-turn-helix transcriptional regulator [Treponema sp.]|nr:helix-turn-helix transcriptional regulator [Treponema sp.]